MIKLGSRGTEVQSWQRFLGIDADGVFGVTTNVATVTWQKAHGLKADGIVGPSTLAAAGLGGDSFAGEIPNKLTPLTPEEAAKAISDGYKQVTGSTPSKAILGLLIGQTALETGNWKSLHNFNFGNAKARSSDPHFQFFRCSEIINGQEVFFDPPSPECKFAAHLTAADGAAHYIKVLKNREHWWNGLQSGTVEGFIEGLTTAPKYFTANPTLYLSVLTDRAAKYADLAKKYSTSILGSIVGFLLLLGGGILGYRYFKS
jgi:hypothetical protein